MAMIFASGLRSIVRQDPDVILVGENPRPRNSPGIAIQASLTGHLVLSTLHTNDAAGAIARLQSLGEKITNIAPALNIVIAQRLVRKVCKDCVKFKKASPEDLKKIKKELDKCILLCSNCHSELHEKIFNDNDNNNYK